MTVQEAIIFFEKYLDEDVYNYKCVEAHRVAIKALEKQIPYRPTKCSVTLGRCKCGVGFLDKSTNYCGNCGQKLDWEVMPDGQEGNNAIPPRTSEE